MPVHLTLTEDPPVGVRGLYADAEQRQLGIIVRRGGASMRHPTSSVSRGTEPLATVAAFIGRPPRPGVQPSPRSSPKALFEILMQGDERTIERATQL
jgi:hypothetical protein